MLGALSATAMSSRPTGTLTAEVGLAGVWTRYDERYSAKQVRTADKSRVMVLPSRIGLSLAYVF